MPSRIDNVTMLPPVMPVLPDEQPLRLPQRYHPAAKLEGNVQFIVDRITDAIHIALKELKVLRVLGFLTTDDLQKLVKLNDSEYAILQELLTEDVKAKLLDLEARVAALEAP